MVTTRKSSWRPVVSSDVDQMPDVMNHRVGQMDAFGIASGLAAIHTRRPDRSLLRFIYDDVAVNGISTR